jgi:hypothetical protein
MIKGLLYYLLWTLILASIGTTIAIIGLTYKPPNNGLILPGALFFFFSPVIVAIGFLIRRNSRHSKDRNAQSLLDLELARQDFLRHRFVERQRLIDAIDRHRVPLRRNLDRAVKTNDYGIVTADGTTEALDEFFASIHLDTGAVGVQEAIEIVFEQLDYQRREFAARGFDTNNLPFDGHAFEQWVADGLTAFGWIASLTKGGGDQGIDVVAEKDGRKVGLQCKLYSRPVGNDAVREAHSGKMIYNVDAVAVITNADFTSSARELAYVNGVGLFSHHDIPVLHEKMFANRI